MKALILFTLVLLTSCSKTTFTNNNTPKAFDLAVQTNENSSVVFELKGSDEDKDSLRFELVTQPVYGTVSLNKNIATYTPTNSFSGNDTFKYKVFDGKKYSDNKTVSITVVDVVLPNTAPVASNITPAAFDEDTESIITLSYFDADVELATSCAVSNLSNVTETQACSCTAGTCTVGVTGTADYNGSSSFDFMVVVNGQNSNNATATLTINPINDQPIIDGTPISVTTNKNVQASGSFSATDVDLDSLTFSLVSAASNGTAVVNADGTFTYQPNASYSGSDSFEIKVNDGTIDSATVTVSVTVNNNLICPSDYIKIPANATLGTTEFCVMQFEARNSAGTATSSSTGTPWVNITATAAKTECSDLGVGHDLISNREWMAISYLIENQAQNWSVSVGSGVLIRGNSDGINGMLSISDVNDPYDQTGNSTISGWEQRRTFYTSVTDLLWDFAGNAWEWVDWTTGGAFDVGFNACTPEAWWELYDIPSVCSPIPNSLDYAPNNPNAISTATYNASYNLGRIYVTSNPLWGAAIRGGYNVDGDNAGIYSLALDAASSDSAFNIGFRCVFR
jgi:VCBS repeat-containing protein